jgi:hypothetical protein
MRVIVPLFNCRFDCNATKFTDLSEESCYKDKGQYKSECINTFLALFGNAKRNTALSRCICNEFGIFVTGLKGQCPLSTCLFGFLLYIKCSGFLPCKH